MVSIGCENQQFTMRVWYDGSGEAALRIESLYLLSIAHTLDKNREQVHEMEDEQGFSPLVSECI